MKSKKVVLSLLIVILLSKLTWGTPLYTVMHKMDDAGINIVCRKALIKEIHKRSKKIMVMNYSYELKNTISLNFSDEIFSISPCLENYPFLFVESLRQMELYFQLLFLKTPTRAVS